MKDKRICVICGGAGSEREVSLRSGNAAYNVLIENGYKFTTLFDLTDSNIGELFDIAPDLCLVAVHGRFGEDGVLQGYMEMMMTPYTGSGVSASVVAFDKYLSKLCFEANKIPTAPHYLTDGVELWQTYPCVVKPSRDGSSVGITIAHDREELIKGIAEARRYDDKVLVEKFIAGKELTVAILDGEIFPPIWIKPKSGVYDYESKYTKGATEYLFDLELAEDEVKAVKDTALRAYRALGCEGVARVDLIYDGKTPYVLEVNTVPGMTETSLLPKACAEAGLSFIALLERMLNGALVRWTYKRK
ncbi:MAG: D-alanine--D-alanine ligase [Deferribacteraceae bacterium]|nr:D-alanine--D-alanine ligase [Deferribacteraceae bacterium]